MSLYKVRARISNLNYGFYLLMIYHELRVEGAPPSPKVVELVNLPFSLFLPPPAKAWKITWS